MFVQWEPFEKGWIVSLWETGWPLWRIAAYVGCDMSVFFHCWQQWSNEYSYTHRPSSGWLCYSTDAWQVQCILKAAMLDNMSHWQSFICIKTMNMLASNQTSLSHHNIIAHVSSNNIREGLHGESNSAMWCSVMRSDFTFMFVLYVHCDIFLKVISHNTPASSIMV